MIKNLKKVISSAAAVAIVASSASAFAVTFPDVDESASYANAVETVSALGVVVGDDNGLFNPDANVTRAEFTTMVVRALGEEAAATAATTPDPGGHDQRLRRRNIQAGQHSYICRGCKDARIGYRL